MKDKKTPMHDEVETMIQQFGLAARVAVEMVKDGQLPFYDWYEEVAKRNALSNTPLDNLRLFWIWDSFRKDPELGKIFHDLSPAGMRWNRNSEPFLVLKRDSQLVIKFQRGPAGTSLKRKHDPTQYEKATLLLLNDLYMRPGRSGRLECCDCDCLLTLRPEEIYAYGREADILGMEKERVKIFGDIIQIEVTSINQAYTVASRRLEPCRRTHGGNIYDHVVYIGEKHRSSLEDIRFAVEKGGWSFSTPTNSPPRSFPLFPDEPD